MHLSLGFDSAGFGEWLLFMAVVLIIVGPKRLPAAARKLGKIMSDIRRSAEAFKNEVMRLDEPPQSDSGPDIPKQGDDPYAPSVYGTEDDPDPYYRNGEVSYGPAAQSPAQDDTAPIAAGDSPADPPSSPDAPADAQPAPEPPPQEKAE